MGRVRLAGRSGRLYRNWRFPRLRVTNCACLLIGMLLGACLLLGVAGVASAQTPVPTTAATPAPGVVAQPVVVVGYGQGSRGVEQALLAVVFIGMTLIVLELFYLLLSGRNN